MLASVYLASTAQGIAVFMIFGAGLVAGLLGQIGDAIGSGSLQRRSPTLTSYALPFEALYQQGLFLLTSDHLGLTGTVVQLGPFGGAQESRRRAAAVRVAYTAAVIGACRGRVRPPRPLTASRLCETRRRDR